MADERFFYGTCIPVYKANCSGNYIDPCDCRKYYHCDSNQYRLISQVCGQSLAFDGGVCVFNTTVLNDGKCSFAVPWRRCNVSAEREQLLQGICTGTSYSLIPTSATQADAEKKQACKNEDNTGLIVGLVIALIITVIIAVAFGVFWMYRRRKQQRNKDVSELSKEEDPHCHLVRAGYQNDIAQETRAARGGDVLYDNFVEQPTASRLIVHSVPQTEPVEESIRNRDPWCRVFPTQLPVHDSHDPADVPLRHMDRQNRGFTVDVSHPGLTMTPASHSSIQVMHTQDQITSTRPSCMSLEHCGSTSANSLGQSVNIQLGEIVRTDSSYVSVRGNDSM